MLPPRSNMIASAAKSISRFFISSSAQPQPEPQLKVIRIKACHAGFEREPAEVSVSYIDPPDVEQVRPWAVSSTICRSSGVISGFLHALDRYPGNVIRL